MNEEIIETNPLPASKVSVCPDCYEYVVSKQKFPVQDASDHPVLWHFYCPRCKKIVVPKLMDIAERAFLNVSKLRKAKKAME